MQKALSTESPAVKEAEDAAAEERHGVIQPIIAYIER